MITRNLLPKAIALSLLLLMSWASEAQAQLPFRTFVSSTGANSNTCERSAPCRTFAGATSKTATGGEITALDSGEYGNVLINKSLTLQAAPGVQAMMGAQVQVSGGISVLGVITVALDDSEVVVLRNLSFGNNRLANVFDSPIFATIPER